MVSLLFVLCLLGCIFSLMQIKKIKKEEEAEKKEYNESHKDSYHASSYRTPESTEKLLNIFSKSLLVFSILTFLFFVWTFNLIVEVGTGHTIGQKIAMYEQENADIEEKIGALVSQYMNYESSTYLNFKDKDETSISLVSYIPELKADELVLRQVDLYWYNRNVITDLKEEEIDLSKAKWKLYFGK